MCVHGVNIAGAGISMLGCLCQGCRPDSGDDRMYGLLLKAEGSRRLIVLLKVTPSATVTWC